MMTLNIQKKRAKSLQSLFDKLNKLKYKSIKLEVLSSSQKIENNVSKVVDFVPIVGSTYQLISAGVYHKLGKSKMVEERLISGTVGLVFDITTVATMGTSLGLRIVGKKIAGKAAEKTVEKTAGKKAGKMVFKMVVKAVGKAMGKKVSEAVVRTIVVNTMQRSNN